MKTVDVIEEMRKGGEMNLHFTIYQRTKHASVSQLE